MNKNDEDFGVVLNCALRYCLENRNLMSFLVINYIVNKLPNLDEKTLLYFERDILDSILPNCCCVQDENIYDKLWTFFLEKVEEERSKRNIGR